MAYTLADVTTLERAIASGVQEITYSDGRRVRYNATQDLMSALSDAKQDLVKGTTKPTVRQIRIWTSKGF
jgi:hypothetical protein